MNKNNSTLEETFTLAYENYQKDFSKVAATLCQKILKIDSNHFGSNFLMGLISLRHKNYDNAIYFFQKGIKINPNFIATYNNLGGTFKELGKLKEARNCYKKAIEINPEYASAYYNIGNLLKEEGKFQDAIVNYNKAIEFYKKEKKTEKNQSNYVNALHSLGGVQRELGKLEEAKNYYEQVIKIKPDHEQAYNNLGIVLKELDKFNEATICYEKAVKIKPNYALAYHNLGIINKLLGNFKKTVNAFQKAIEYEPDNLFHYYHLSDFKKEILDKKTKNKINKIVNTKNTSKINLAYGNFLLSKYELEDKNYKKELDYLLKGHLCYSESTNEKFRKGTEYALNKLPNIIKFSNLNNLSDEAVKNNSYKIKPIFIIGVPRCGSTLVEKVIAANDTNIPIGEETAILSVFFEQEKLLEKKSINVRDIENFRMKLLDKYKRKKLISERSNYIFTDKSLDNFFYIGLIKAIYPHAKVINCKRNALSSIVSILQNNLTGISWAHDIENIFRYFDIYHRMINNYVKIFPNFVYELELEKFTNNPESESKKLMEYCDLPWNEKCLEYYKRKDVISQTASNIQIREAIYKTSNEKYLPYKKFLTQYGEKYSWFK